MDLPWLPRVAALPTFLLVFAACSGGGEPTPSPDLVKTGSATVAAAELPACSNAEGVARDIPDWPLAGGGDPDFLPVVMSSLVTGGYNRFLYNVLDESWRQVAAPDVASRVDFYAIERDPQTPACAHRRHVPELRPWPRALPHGGRLRLHRRMGCGGLRRER